MKNLADHDIAPVAIVVELHQPVHQNVGNPEPAKVVSFQ